MQRWLRKQPALSRDELAEEFETNRNYYFIAYPESEGRAWVGQSCPTKN
jgi:hypothetical protein